MITIGKSEDGNRFLELNQINGGDTLTIIIEECGTITFSHYHNSHQSDYEIEAGDVGKAALSFIGLEVK